MEQIRVGEEEEQQSIQTIEEETLPKSKGWMTTHLVQYQNVWLSLGGLRGALMAHQHFHARPSDIVAVTSPKAGTTWFKAILFSLMNRTLHRSSANPLLTTGPHDCVPFIETMADRHALLHLPSPRLLATHIPYSLLPISLKSSAAKIVYICRNPKDLLVSQWNYFTKLRDKNLPPLSLPEAFELFCKGQTHFGPYWDHVLGYWNESLRSPEKVLFLHYEDMKEQPVAQVKRVARFVGRPFSPEEEEQGRVEELVELCSFERLSNLEVNKSGVQRFSSQFAIGNHNFFRKGVVGDWRNHLTEAMGEELDRITLEKFGGSGLELDPN